MSFRRINLMTSPLEKKVLKAEITIMNLDSEIVGFYHGERLYLQNLFFNLFNDAPELIEMAEASIVAVKHLHKLNAEIEDYQRIQNEMIDNPNKLQEL